MKTPSARNVIPTSRRAGSALATLLLACALSACGDDGNGATTAVVTGTDIAADDATHANATASTPGCEVDALTPICTRVALTGAAAVSGAQATAAVQDEAMKSTCADYAAGGRDKHGRTRFTLPRGLTGADGGPTALFDVVIPGERFHGPGDYTGEDLDIGEVTVGDVLFKRGPETRIRATLRADGGGRLEFSDAVAADGRRESGSMQWTCSM